MQKKPPTSAYLLRRIQVYKKRYEAAVELRRQQAEQLKKYKASLHEVLQGKVRANRLLRNDLARAKETIASNGMTMCELQNQLAVQFKLLAEARSDVARATELYNEAAEKHKIMADSFANMRAASVRHYEDSEHLKAQLLELRDALTEARLSFSYRTWHAIICAYHRTRVRIKVEYAFRRERLINWWAIRRLNKSRVTAMNQAGFIPEKLVKLALQYWEVDKQRIRDGEWGYDSGGQPVQISLGLLRRMRILMGRA